MKTLVKMTVNGKEFTNPDEAFKQIYYENMIAQVNAILTPFEKEIISQGGGVEINFVDHGPDVVPQMDVSIDRISEDLMDRISKRTAAVKAMHR